LGESEDLPYETRGAVRREKKLLYRVAQRPRGEASITAKTDVSERTSSGLPGMNSGNASVPPGELKRGIGELPGDLLLPRCARVRGTAATTQPERREVKRASSWEEVREARFSELIPPASPVVPNENWVRPALETEKHFDCEPREDKVLFFLSCG